MFVNYSYHNNKQPLTPKLVVPMNESPENVSGDSLLLSLLITGR